MTKIQVNLSKIQAEELEHRLAVVANEPDLLEDYGVSESDIEQLSESLPERGGRWVFPARFAELVKDEAEVIADLSFDPWAESMAYQPGDYKSAVNLEKKVREI